VVKLLAGWLRIVLTGSVEAYITGVGRYVFFGIAIRCVPKGITNG